jgi:Zn-dependent peptidase ImmA (M78 family)/DNA-binding XRE family transcriptional regulator
VVTKEELARRIRAAREACHLTQDEAARQLGVSRSTYVQIEGANRSVSSLELDRLAFLFGRDLRELVADRFRDEDPLAALFRAETGAREEPEMRRRLRECMALARELTNLERLVGIDRDLAALPTYVYPVAKTRWEAIQQGERLADEERRRLGLGQGPVGDLGELLEAQGIRTGVVTLPPDVSGITLADPGVGLFVVVNRAHHHLRRRFSFAHEYAHVIADRDRSGVISRGSQREDLVEVRANAFAARFLMPEDGVRQAVAGLGKGKPSRAYLDVFDEAATVKVEGRAEPGTQRLQLYDVVRLAHHFGVSRSAMLYRVRDLRLLTDQEHARLRAREEQGSGKDVAELLGLRESDHAEARGEFTQRFLGLALEAYRRDEISRSKLRELVAMVGMSDDDLDRLLDETGLDVSTDARGP